LSRLNCFTKNQWLIALAAAPLLQGATHYCDNPLPQKGADCAKETFLSFLRFLRLSFIIQDSLELSKSELHPLFQAIAFIARLAFWF
jgi:hypothetical protein